MIVHRTRSADGSIRVHCSGASLLLLGIAMIAGGIYLLVAPSPQRGQVAGGGVILGLGLICGLVAEWSDFTFDATGRVLRWRRARAFTRQSGTVPFSDIREVVVGPWFADADRGARPSTRLVVVSAQGRIPVTSHYSSLGNLAAYADELRGLLGK